MMTFKFWMFLFGLHRKSNESQKKNIYIYIPLSLVIYSSSKIVILMVCLKASI